MNIIFITLPRYLTFIAVFFQKIGFQVYYIHLSGFKNITTECKKVEILKRKGVLPLPLADLPHYSGFSQVYFDLDWDLNKKTEKLAPSEFISAISDIFPNINNLEKKIQLTINSEVIGRIADNPGKIRIWAETYQNEKHVVIDTNFFSFYMPKNFPKNVQLFVIPIDNIFQILLGTISIIFERITSICIFSKRLQKNTIPVEKQINRTKKRTVAFIPHKGLTYGNLFPKDLFFSEIPNSEFNRENMLYLDYNGYPSPSENLDWVNIANHTDSWRQNISNAIIVLKKGLPNIRNFQNLFGFFLIIRSYIIYQSFLKKLEEFPDLKIALIDYDIVCPKELILAFESKGIRTIATQERLNGIFDNLFSSLFISDYFCGSVFAKDIMRKNPIVSIDRYFPVGQYRSDNLFFAKNDDHPEVLKEPCAKGLRIITALGFHTYLEWHNSQTSLFLNWKAHRQFLEDMIRLSGDFPDVFIILRFKFTDWMSLPVFSDLINIINSIDNMTISTDYEKMYLSYDLCAHSDLVIAKYTSLADECLSVGIPVIFHEYTHNTERLMADAYDYSPAKIMCFNYEELKERTRDILNGSSPTMTKNFEYLKTVVYGGLGDGHVRERIHRNINEILHESLHKKNG